MADMSKAIDAAPTEPEESAEPMDEFSMHAKDAGFEGEQAAALKRAIQACKEEGYSDEEPATMPGIGGGMGGM